MVAEAGFGTLAALSIARNGLGFLGNRQAENDAIRQQRRIAEVTAAAQQRTAENAVQEFTQRTIAERILQQQNREVASNEYEREFVQARQAVGEALAGGTFGGAGLQRIITDAQRDEAVNRAIIAGDLRRGDVSAEQNINSYGLLAQNRIDAFQGYQPSTIRRGGLFGSILNVGSDLLSGYITLNSGPSASDILGTSSKNTLSGLGQNSNRDIFGISLGR